MKTLLTKNSKMKKATLNTMNFDLPLTTCIGAGKCKDNCYAQGFLYQMDNVINKHKWNLEQSKMNDFHKKIDAEIKFFKVKDNLQAVRIHSAGDFYNREYLNKWLTGKSHELNQIANLALHFCYGF
jgi:ferredoxin